MYLEVEYLSISPVTTTITLGSIRTNCTDDFIELASPEAHALPWKEDLLAKIR